MGVTELGRMLESDPTMALSVLYACGRWEARRSWGGGGAGPAVQGLGEDGEGGGEQQQAENQHRQQWCDNGSPKAPKPPSKGPQKRPGSPSFSRVARKQPPRPQPKPNAMAKAKAKAKPAPPNPKRPVENRGRNPYLTVSGVEDARYVPWSEAGNGGTVSQVTVLGAGDEELDSGEWWVVSQVSNGMGRKNEKRGKKRKRDKEGGTFRVAGELPFRTRKEAEVHLREVLEEVDDGDDEDDWGGGDDKKARGVTTESEKGGARSKDAPRQPCKKVSLRVANPERGVGGPGADRANQANRAHPPPSDPAPACHLGVTSCPAPTWRYGPRKSVL